MADARSAAPTPARPTIRSRLLALGELRDVAFVLATTCYVLGYATWAFYSVYRGLGVLPPIEGQYFLAGILPLLLILVTFWTIRSLRSVGGGKAKKLAWIGYLGPIIVGPPLIWLFNKPQSLVSKLVVGLTGMGIMIGFLILTGLEDRVGSWIARVLLPAYASLLVYTYLTFVFPLIPQEFGGPRPLCVGIDIKANALSRATVKFLGGDTLSAPGSAVAVGPFWLHFNGGGILVFSWAQGRQAYGVVRVQESEAGVLIVDSELCRKAQAGPDSTLAPGSTKGTHDYRPRRN